MQSAHIVSACGAFRFVGTEAMYHKYRRDSFQGLLQRRSPESYDGNPTQSAPKVIWNNLSIQGHHDSPHISAWNLNPGRKSQPFHWCLLRVYPVPIVVVLLTNTLPFNHRFHFPAIAFSGGFRRTQPYDPTAATFWITRAISATSKYLGPDVVVSAEPIGWIADGGHLSGCNCLLCLVCRIKLKGIELGLVGNFSSMVIYCLLYGMINQITIHENKP